MTSLPVVTFVRRLIVFIAPYVAKEKMDGTDHTLTLLLAFWKHCF